MVIDIRLSEHVKIQSAPNFDTNLNYSANPKKVYQVVPKLKNVYKPRGTVGLVLKQNKQSGGKLDSLKTRDETETFTNRNNL